MNSTDLRKKKLRKVARNQARKYGKSEARNFSKVCSKKQQANTQEGMQE